jgi:hypothetical protein
LVILKGDEKVELWAGAMAVSWAVVKGDELVESWVGATAVRSVAN